jgi:hypothetical protein
MAGRCLHFLPEARNAFADRGDLAFSRFDSRRK